MGHIILIAEEIVKFLARCPPELYACIKDSFNISEWESFVEGSLQETKARDTRPLAGGKPMPVVAPNEIHPIMSEDSSDDEEEAKIGEPLTRTVAADGFAARPGSEAESEVSQLSWMIIIRSPGAGLYGIWIHQMRMKMMRTGCGRARTGEGEVMMILG